MALYLRGYKEFSFELIFTDGRLKKRRIHLLINPNKYIRILRKDKSKGPEVNPASLTHIVCLLSSQSNNRLIEKTLNIAELTNKPIITDNFTSEILKKGGIPSRQLRILGFDDQIITGLKISPLVLDSSDLKASGKDSNHQNPPKQVVENHDEPKFREKFGISPVLSLVKSNLGKLTKFPLSKIKDTVLPGSNRTVDWSKPFGLELYFGKRIKMLIPLNKQALELLPTVLPSIQSFYLILPDMDLDESVGIKAKTNTLIILNKNYSNEEPTIIPMNYNPNSDHNTIYTGFENWVQLDDISF